MYASHNKIRLCFHFPSNKTGNQGIGTAVVFKRQLVRALSMALLVKTVFPPNPFHCSNRTVLVALELVIKIMSQVGQIPHDLG